MDSSIEKVDKIITMLDALNENLTDEVIENATTEELIQYYEMITKIQAKIKNLK